MRLAWLQFPPLPLAAGFGMSDSSDLENGSPIVYFASTTGFKSSTRKWYLACRASRQDLKPSDRTLAAAGAYDERRINPRLDSRLWVAATP
jgi:hypothetical protein